MSTNIFTEVIRIDAMKLVMGKSGVLGVCLMLVITGCAVVEKPAARGGVTNIMVNVGTVLADVSQHPVGINVDYFMDSDWFAPKRGTAEALKAMGVKYLRYPGGEKSDTYLWSVPPYDRSIPTMARTGEGCVSDWGDVFDNYATFKHDVLDFDEFMSMCRQVGAEPVVVVAADGYLADYPEPCTFTGRDRMIETAAAWVRYANIKKKYGVKYWMIGNETWHEKNKNSTGEIYAKDVVDFSKAMKAVDPSIKVIPNGSDFKWWEKVFAAGSEHIDGLCLSNYPIWNYEEGYKTYRESTPDLIPKVHDAARAIEKFVPEKRKAGFKIIVAEYGPFDWAKTWPHINDTGHALCNFEMAGQQMTHPKVEFSCFWNTRWIHNLTKEHQVFDALNKEGNFNPTGYAIAIWGNFAASKMVYSSSSVRVRTFASVNSDRKQLYIYIINKSENEESIALDIAGASVDSLVQRWELVGKNDKDTEPVWRENKSASKDDLHCIVVPGISITVIEYRIK